MNRLFRKAGLASILLVVPVILGAMISVPKGPSPHGVSGACNTCHVPPPKGSVPDTMTWVGGSPDSACGQCHSYAHHQSLLDPVRTHVPSDMPLVGGRLACVTCHFEHSDAGRPPVPSNEYRFRGGPFVRIGELCARCHAAQKSTERFSPHRAYDPVKDRAVCMHCHTETPDPSKPIGELRVLSKNICLGCHQTDAHAGAREHVGQVPAGIRWQSHRAELPLTEDGSMGCITCHDPHPAGVFARTDLRQHWIGKPTLPDDWRNEVLLPALKAREAEVQGKLDAPDVEPDFLWLPTRNGRLCQACHEPANIDAARRKQ
jgi:hypothetical protein